MKNGIGKLDLGNLADTAVTAIVFAIVSALVTIVGHNGFSLFTTDWIVVGKNMLDIAFVSAVVTIGQDLMTMSNGSVLGITPASTPPQA